MTADTNEPMSTLSPKALLREAFARRRAEYPDLTQRLLAALAGLAHARVGEALSASGGEPHPKNVAEILRALGFEFELVDVGMPLTEQPGMPLAEQPPRPRTRRGHRERPNR